MTQRQDLTQYSDSELSLHVFNDETLYRMCHRSGFDEVIDQLFIYTPEQWHELAQDLGDDLEECA
jgi:hypothetical protein